MNRFPWWYAIFMGALVALAIIEGCGGPACAKEEDVERRGDCQDQRCLDCMDAVITTGATLQFDQGEFNRMMRALHNQTLGQ